MCTVNINNIEDICRICLKETYEKKSLFTKLDENEIIEPNITQWSEVLCRILNTQILTSGKPTLICTTCSSIMLTAYKFKVQYDISEAILEEYLSRQNSQDIIDSKCDIFIENRRQTSDQRIVKRESITVPKKLSRKCKSKFKTESVVNNTPFVLHPCPICTKQFTALDLRKHAHTHNALKKYLKIPHECKVDPTIRFYKTVVENIQVSGEVKLHKCGECHKEFTATDLQIHLQTHKNKTEFKCKNCPRTFKKLNHLNTHNVQHLKERPFKCEQCGKGFVIQTNYECHMLTHNTSLELPHECRYCLKRFSNPEHLNRHIVMHTENVSYSVKYKVSKCYQCLKSFKDKNEKLLHTCHPIESSNQNYECITCNKVFKNAPGLYNHNRNTHKLKSAKVLCSVCGNYVTNIYNHMMWHSGEKPFECNLCGKRFVSKPQLRQHLLVHSGVKPFVCSVCAKAFNNLYNLQVHERIHKGDRCHICPICSKGFLEKSYLKKHLIVHTKI